VLRRQTGWLVVPTKFWTFLNIVPTGIRQSSSKRLRLADFGGHLYILRIESCNLHPDWIGAKTLEKKMNIKVTLFVGLMFCGLSFAHADIGQVDSKFKACAENAESTADQNNCGDQAFKAADAELNRVYNSIKSPLAKGTDSDSKEILKRLVASERAWVSFRDSNCQLAGTQMLNGSGEGPIVGGCLASMTIERVKELQSFFPAN
jgi:uncharacterized protein YecT (DUF1311 family)